MLLLTIYSCYFQKCTETRCLNEKDTTYNSFKFPKSENTFSGSSFRSLASSRLHEASNNAISYTMVRSVMRKNTRYDITSRLRQNKSNRHKLRKCLPTALVGKRTNKPPWLRVHLYHWISFPSPSEHNIYSCDLEKWTKISRAKETTQLTVLVSSLNSKTRSQGALRDCYYSGAWTEHQKIINMPKSALRKNTRCDFRSTSKQRIQVDEMSPNDIKGHKQTTVVLSVHLYTDWVPSDITATTATCRHGRKQYIQTKTRYLQFFQLLWIRKHILRELLQVISLQPPARNNKESVIPWQNWCPATIPGTIFPSAKDTSWGKLF